MKLRKSKNKKPEGMKRYILETNEEEGDSNMYFICVRP